MKTTRTTKTTKMMLGLAALMLGLAGACASDDPGQPGQPGNSNLEVLGSKQSACKANTSGDSSYALGTISAKVSGGNVTILHDDARYNCASKLKLDATVAGNVITVTETIANPGELARCMCNYDLQLELKGLAAGTYTVQVIDAEGKDAGATSFSLGGAAPTVESQQSACKGSPEGTYSAAGLKAVPESGGLRVSHEDAIYNCASKVELVAAVAGNQITITEKITNPGELALCTCTYDLSVLVKGLAAGAYVVTVVDADGKTVGTSQVTL